MPRISIEKNGNRGTYAGDLRLSHAWGCPAHVTIPTIIGDFHVQVETEKMTSYDGDQPDWLVFHWSLYAVEKVVGHEVVFPGTIGPRGTKIKDHPNRETRHAHIIAWDWVSKFVRIEVPKGGEEGRADRQLEVDLEYKRKLRERASEEKEVV